MHMIPIVSSLASNTSVKELHLSFRSLSLDTSLALGNLLESTTTIERFELELGDDDVEVNPPAMQRLELALGGAGNEVDTFRPISQGLIQSTSVTDLRFVTCYFSHQVVHVVNSILASKSNLQSLTLEHCFVHEDGRQELRAAILNLLQPHSLLCSLEINHLSHYGFGSSQDFGRLVTAVETSPLERFAVETINSRENCLTLIASIPKMQVRTLEFELRLYNHEDFKEGFMGALKRNSSLRTVVAKLRGNRHAWLDDHDEMKLLSYSARNEFLAQWMENPNLLPNAAWPEYLAVSQSTGQDTVFRMLLALAPFLGLLEGVQRRKRRRPNFYSPS
jgi:hypothetical protein